MRGSFTPSISHDNSPVILNVYGKIDRKMIPQHDVIVIDYPNIQDGDAKVRRMYSRNSSIYKDLQSHRFTPYSQPGLTNVGPKHQQSLRDCSHYSYLSPEWNMYPTYKYRYQGYNTNRNNPYPNISHDSTHRTDNQYSSHCLPNQFDSSNNTNKLEKLKLHRRLKRYAAIYDRLKGLGDGCDGRMDSTPNNNTSSMTYLNGTTSNEKHVKMNYARSLGSVGCKTEIFQENIERRKVYHTNTNQNSSNTKQKCLPYSVSSDEIERYQKEHLANAAYGPSFVQVENHQVRNETPSRMTSKINNWKRCIEDIGQTQEAVEEDILEENVPRKSHNFTSVEVSNRVNECDSKDPEEFKPDYDYLPSPQNLVIDCELDLSTNFENDRRDRSRKIVKQFI